MTSRSDTADTGPAEGGDTAPQDKRNRPVCMKCKCKPAEVAARQREPLCRGCLCDGLVSKVRGGVRGSSSIEPGDNVLIALSGGAASQAMLYFLKQMHNRDRERLERGQVAFDLNAVHVIEAAIVASQGSDSKAPRQLVDSCHKAGIPLHVIPLEAIFLPVCEPILNATSGCCPSLHHLQSDLHRLLQAVSDVTGKEDLIAALRKALLLRAAAQLSCNKVAIGTSATRMAVRAVAMSAKGSGYALPGAIHFTDSRHGSKSPTVIQPVREVGMRELAMLCHFQGLHVAAPLYSPASGKTSINTLSEQFVARLQANVPSSVSTILRTACKLKAFPWNECTPGSTAHPAGQPAALDVLCPICSSPLTNAEIKEACQSAAHKDSKERLEQARLSSSCCYSCRFQIVATNAASKAALSHDKDVRHRGSLLDAMLLPLCIQQNAHRIADAAMQAVAVTDDKHHAGRPYAALDAHASHRDHMRAQLAAYLLD
ncbi:hypothetical protein WJX77_006664 [Trebouxia sp. C0004]